MSARQEETFPKVFINQVKRKADKAFLIYKNKGKWQEVLWNEVGEKVKHISLGLIVLGVEKGDRIASMSETCPEQAYCCQAIVNAGAIFTGIYHTNSPTECAHVINDSRAKIAFAGDQEKLDKLKEAWNRTPSLEKIIVFGNFKPENNPRIMSLARLSELGKEEFFKNGDQVYFDRIFLVKPDDAIAIIYSSGTTGPPKGSIDTNSGVIAGLNELYKIYPSFEKDRGISFLPMAHGLELREGHWRHIYWGYPQIYAESIEALFKNIYETEPTLILSPPLFFEKHYNKILEIIEDLPWWRKKIINWCTGVGYRYRDVEEKSSKNILYIYYLFLYSIAYLVFFRRVRKILGRKIRWALAGAAPMPPKIKEFFKAIGLPLCNAYGLTEHQGFISITRPGADKAGTAGKPIDEIEVSIAGDGEILAKSSWGFCGGYWNNPQATEELFRDGWLHTGDVGFLDGEGFLHITGRKKELLITSSGKNITPSNIENLLKTSHYISQAIVFGDGKKYLTALVILDGGKVRKYALDNKISYTDFADLTRKEEIVDLIEREIKEKNKELSRIEQIKKFTILEKELSEYDEEFTPTLKIRRRIFENKYKDKIEAMYPKEFSDFSEEEIYGEK
ncbi:MAG: long-chain fatty acid--CoA ligase [Thermodesulfobacteriota bacterium]|jgi:long-chain acyl-CoA synthetase